MLAENSHWLTPPPPPPDPQSLFALSTSCGCPRYSAVCLASGRMAITRARPSLCMTAALCSSSPSHPLPMRYAWSALDPCLGMRGPLRTMGRPPHELGHSGLSQKRTRGWGTGPAGGIAMLLPDHPNAPGSTQCSRHGRVRRDSQALQDPAMIGLSGGGGA